MPLSALPEHLNSKEEIEANFPDDSQYGEGWFGRIYKRYNKATKTWFAFSYRCTEWWARWRKYPKVLFAIKSRDGYFRIETAYPDGSSSDCAYIAKTLFNTDVYHVNNYNPHCAVISQGYLSRIQYWCRWHFAVQWPLMISFHFYPKASDVPLYGQPRPELDGKLWFAYWGHFDADLVYWMITSAYLGRNFK